jgi:hypothetical protein
MNTTVTYDKHASLQYWNIVNHFNFFYCLGILGYLLLSFVKISYDFEKSFYLILVQKSLTDFIINLQYVDLDSSGSTDDRALIFRMGGGVKPAPKPSLRWGINKESERKKYFKVQGGKKTFS